MLFATNVGTVTFDKAQRIKMIEASYKLATVDEKNNTISRPTIEFLKEVAGLIGKKCTITQAYQIWKSIFISETHAQKTQADRSAIAFWYGINPYKLTDVQLSGLHANLPVVKAQQALETGNFDPLNPESVYQLVLTAYSDESQALKARAKSIEAKMNVKSQGRLGDGNF